MQALPAFCLRAETAFFFDFDGTLVELAPTPDGVLVQPRVTDLLSELRSVTNGAVAVVSGRGIDSIDSVSRHARSADRRPARRRAARLERRHAAHRLSRRAAAAHGAGARAGGQRATPACCSRSRARRWRCTTAMRRIASRWRARRPSGWWPITPAAYVLQPGKMVYEIKPKDVDKGRAMRAFLERAAVRRPQAGVCRRRSDRRERLCRRQRARRACRSRSAPGETMAHTRIDSVPGCSTGSHRSSRRRAQHDRRAASLNANNALHRESRFMSRLIIVSNRVAPISEGGPAAGGLAVGVYDALKETGGMWFGWSGDVLSSGQPQIKVEERGPVTFATIALMRRDYDQYYRGFSNATLWPAFHYRADLLQYDRHDFEGYCRVNCVARATARAAAARRRRDLGPRLSSDSVRAGAARGGREEPHRLLPAHSVSGFAGAAGGAAASRTGRGAVFVRSARLPDRAGSARVLRLHRQRGERHGRRIGERPADDPRVRPHAARGGVSDRRLSGRDRRTRESRRKRGKPVRTDEGDAAFAQADHERRPARLFEGTGRAVSRVRAAARTRDRAAQQGVVPADRAADARRHARVSGHPLAARRRVGAHQRTLRRTGLDADPLHPQAVRALGAGRAVPHRARRLSSRRCATA